MSVHARSPLVWSSFFFLFFFFFGSDAELGMNSSEWQPEVISLFAGLCPNSQRASCFVTSLVYASLSGWANWR